MSRWGCDGEAQICFENTFLEYSQVILHTQDQYTKDKIHVMYNKFMSFHMLLNKLRD